MSQDTGSGYSHSTAERAPCPRAAAREDQVCGTLTIKGRSGGEAQGGNTVWTGEHSRP